MVDPSLHPYPPSKAHLEHGHIPAPCLLLRIRRRLQGGANGTTARAPTASLLQLL